MAKEYLGVNAVNDLFDIIDENYVSKEDFENKNKDVASAICVGSALIAQSLLKLAKVIALTKGAEGGGDDDYTEIIDDDSPYIATNDEINDILENFFN